MMFQKMTSWVVVLMLLVGVAFVDWVSAQDDTDSATPDVTPAMAEDADAAVVDATTDGEEEDDRTEEEKQLAVAEAVRGGLVVVQYHLQYDKGEDPTMYGSGQGRYLASLIEQERPLEVPGFLVADDKVITADLIIHPRFIKSITVSFGEGVAEATPAGWAMDQSAMLLALNSALAGAAPLTFDPSAEESLGVVYRMTEGEWSVMVSGVSTTTVIPEEGAPYSEFSENLLLVDDDGLVVGISMADRFDIGDEHWRGSPLEWDWLDADAMTTALEEVQALSEAVLVRVQLSFRSPPKRADMMGMGGGSYDDDDTEKDCLGVLLDGGRVLVLESLRQRTTRRLERITVHVGEGDPLEAEFVGSLEDYGALVARITTEMDEPLPGVVLATGNVRDWRGRMLMLADVKMQGDNRIAYFAHDRIIGYAIGWQENVYPVLPGSEQNLFLFNAEGELVSFPIARRRKTTVDSGYGAPSAVATAAAQLAFLTADDLAEYVDEANIPVSEEDERKLAWIGVTLQGMSRDLAREYGVSDLTSDGANGAIVGYVYPGSPAAEAGVEAEWVLLRLHVEGEPKPLEVSARPWVWEVDPFPWDIYLPGEVPVEVYDQIPTPWAPAETTLARKLTDLGFGTAFEAEFFVDGNIVRVPFTVVESPDHYESAPRYENEEMGMTVRDLTYEVRRYLRRNDDDPGVVVSKIEPGSLAAVAEIMPFEVITYVNGEPVYSVEDFEMLIAGQEQLRFEVLHMTQSRLAAVKMPIDTPAEEELIEDPEELGDEVLDADVDDLDGVDEMDDEDADDAGPGVDTDEVEEHEAAAPLD